MKFIYSYFKMGVIIACTLLGIQVPGFVDDYGKHLNARLIESNQAVAEFQDDADKFFGGDLNKLVTHYKTSNDDVFTEGGNSIEAVVSRNTQLKHAWAKFKQSMFGAYSQTLATPIPEVRQEVWKNYSFNVLLNKSTIIIGVVIGFLCLLLFELSVFLGKQPFKRKKWTSQQT